MKNKTYDTQEDMEGFYARFQLKLDMSKEK